jgi:arylsulfatase A-like enzyme
MYEPDDVSMPIAPVPPDARHPLHEYALTVAASTAPTDPHQMRELRAQYYGMISEVDAQLGIVVATIEERGEWDDTLVVITSDHGEQLGDHGLIEKLGFFPQSYHVVGLWRDPRSNLAGKVISQFTENVDLMPTLADALGVTVPVQCDGRSLTPLITDDNAPWRSAVHYEWDYRRYLIGSDTPRWPVERSLSQQNLAVTVSDDYGYVQFAEGSSLCFDLAKDPTWRTESHDADFILHAAQVQLMWRQQHLRREMTDMLLKPSRPGHWPANYGENRASARAVP